MLLPAPDRPLRAADLRHPESTPRSPHRGGQVAVLGARRPDRASGCDVRADAALVKIYHRGRLVKVHPRRPAGGRSTDAADLPAERAGYALRDVDGLRAKAAGHGAAVGELRRPAARRAVAVDPDAAGLPAARPGPHATARTAVDTACAKRPRPRRRRRHPDRPDARRGPGETPPAPEAAGRRRAAARFARDRPPTSTPRPSRGGPRDRAPDAARPGQSRAGSGAAAPAQARPAAWTPCPNGSPWPAASAAPPDFLMLLLSDEVTRRDQASAELRAAPPGWTRRCAWTPGTTRRRPRLDRAPGPS